MELPEPILLKMMREHTIILDNTLYKVEFTEDPFTGDSFEQDGILCPIVRLETIGNLEKFYRVNRAREIEQWKEQSVREFRVSEHGSEQLKKLQIENVLLDFIVNEVFPYFLEGEEDRLGDFMRQKMGKKPRQPEDRRPGPGPAERKDSKTPMGCTIDDALEEAEEYPEYDGDMKERDNMPPVDIFERLIEARDSLSKKKADILDSLLGRKREAKKEQKKSREVSSTFYDSFLGRKNILVIDQMVLELETMLGTLEEDSIKINIKGMEYTPMRTIDYDHRYKNPLVYLKKEYMKHLMNVFKEEALSAHPEIDRIMVKNRELVKRLEIDDYKKAGLSLQKERFDSYYICLEVPPYANRDPDTGNLLKFHLVDGKLAPVHVGVRLQMSGDTVGFSTPVVMEGIKNPFLRESTPLRPICLGNYSLPRNYSTKQAVAVLLRKGRITLTSGYHGSLTPYHWLHDTQYFRQNICTKEEIDSLGLKITNI